MGAANGRRQHERPDGYVDVLCDFHKVARRLVLVLRAGGRLRRGRGAHLARLDGRRLLLLLLLVLVVLRIQGSRQQHGRILEASDQLTGNALPLASLLGQV